VETAVHNEKQNISSFTDPKYQTQHQNCIFRQVQL